jgi:hypothetical protein
MRAGWPLPWQEDLLRAALLRDDRAIEAWSALQPEITRLFGEGAIAAFATQLRRNLARLGFEDELLARLRAVEREIWAHNRRLVSVAAPHLEALEGAGIPTLLLKGAAVLAQTDHAATFRLLGDVDVLVPTVQRAAALDLLCRRGLEPDFGRPRWYVLELAPLFNPSYPLIDRAGLELDLHWHVLHCSRQPDADEDFWAAALPVRFGEVDSRTLCATDALLHALLHGVLDNLPPGFRWVMDAALILEGDDEIDFDRLVDQARRRRVSHAVAVALGYLQRLLDAPVPRSALRSLRPHRPRPLQRLELRASWRSADAWRALDQITIRYQQHARTCLPIGERASLRLQLRSARDCFGVNRVRDLWTIPRGGTAGPFRPSSRNDVPIGGARGRLSVPTVKLGVPVGLDDPDRVRELFEFGAWVSSDDGVWLAGREARLVIPHEGEAGSSLLLELSGENFLFERTGRARLRVLVAGSLVGTLGVSAGCPRLHQARVRLPAALIHGGSPLEIDLRMPDAISPARLRLSDDDRQLGFFLRELALVQPPLCAAGQSLAFGTGGDGEGALLDGWGEPEQHGRWTIATRASLVLRVDAHDGPLELLLDATPFSAAGAAAAVELLVGGRLVARIDCSGSDRTPIIRRVLLPDGSGEGELYVELAIPGATAPHSLGLSDDRRKLGLLVRSIGLELARPAPAL